MKREDYVNSQIYRPFAEGGSMRANPAQNREDHLFRMYVRIISELCSNRFNWQGLPETIDARYLEVTLMHDALAVFYYDQEFARFMALRATGLGQLNMYNNPTEFVVYGNQVYSKTLSAKSCVPIWANYMRCPDWDVIDTYAQRLAAFDRTLEINMLNARHPIVFAVNNNEYHTFVQAYNKVVEGQPVIFATETMNRDSLADKVAMFDTGYKPHQIQDVMEAKVKTWNECMTLLGIMNVNSEKRERMVVEEASGSSGQVLGMRAVALNARRAACDQINRMFKLDVHVEWNLDQTSEPGEDPMEMMAMQAAMGGLGSTDLEAMNPHSDKEPTNA